MALAEHTLRENRQRSMVCPKRCSHEKYSYTKANLGTNTKGTANKTSLWAQFNLPHVIIEEEYRLFDTVAIISATGGSLGLFLGLSCYSMIWTGFEWIEKCLSRLMGAKNIAV